MKQKVFVIVLNYNRPQDTIKCITSLQKSHPPKSTQFVIVDNSQNKHPHNIFSTKFSRLKYIKSPKNLGFAGGNNQGIEYSLKHGATHILIVNPDVIVPDKLISSLLSVFAKNPDAGIVAPIHKHQQKNLNFYGYGGNVDWKLAKFTHENSRKKKYTSPKEYDFVTFACVLISRETFQKTNLLDDDYFLYIEDVDYCLQARKQGLLSYIDPRVVIDHHTSSSFDNPTSKLKYSLRSHLKFIFKWYNFPKVLVPLVYNLYFYTYLYLLWTYQYYNNFRTRKNTT